MAASDADISFEREGSIGRIVLNRPKALNTLTRAMCHALEAQLRTWDADDTLGAMVITGAGGRAFCAGGDIVELFCAYQRDGNGAAVQDFFRTEYHCNMRIAALRKPYVALMDGVVMGGGAGVSIHGSHRVVTDRTLFAMPETRIGLVPDVGASYFLTRLPAATAMYLALTGARLTGAHCVTLGLAQSYVPHERLPALLENLARTGDATAAIAAAAVPALAPLAHADLIALHFRHDSVEDIFESLAMDQGAWAMDQLATLRTFSPLSLKLTFREMRAGARLSRADCLRMEWRLARRIAEGDDFYEGVRALLVDKDNRPQWRHKTLADVSDAIVEDYFAPLASDELDLSDIIAPS